MTIPVRVPSTSEDQPRWAILAGIAIVCAAAGLGLARWGTYGRHEAAHEPTEEAPSEPAQVEREEAREEASERPPDDGEPEVAPEPEIAAAPQPEPEAAELPVELPTPPVREEAPRDVTRERIALRIVRGRVAYLRCEGVPQRSGPVPCPRDESLEAATWAAIDGLASCAALPAREGEADLVLDFAAADAAPELRARDTFASDVVRLDAAPVVQCLTPALGTLRQTMGSSRLVASFRFAARALDR